MKKIFILLLIASFMVACKKTTQVTSPVLGKLGNGVTDIDGNTYKTTIIGTQEWMTENLKVSKYNDGKVIPNITDSSQWSDDTLGAWCYYNNDITNNPSYGKLYNWYVISTTTNSNKKNICPTGWHVPTDNEWTVLTDYLGGESVAGDKLKAASTLGWSNLINKDATNTSLFTAVPGGYRLNNGFFMIGDNGNWWSSSIDSNRVWTRDLNAGFDVVFIRHHPPMQRGLSIRCVKN